MAKWEPFPQISSKKSLFFQKVGDLFRFHAVGNQTCKELVHLIIAVMGHTSFFLFYRRQAQWGQGQTQTGWCRFQQGGTYIVINCVFLKLYISVRINIQLVVGSFFLGKEFPKGKCKKKRKKWWVTTPLLHSFWKLFPALSFLFREWHVTSSSCLYFLLFMYESGTWHDDSRYRKIPQIEGLQQLGFFDCHLNIQSNTTSKMYKYLQLKDFISEKK